MAVAYDNSTSSAGTFGSTLTFSHTTSGSGRVAYVSVLDYNKVGVSSVTYGGVAMTLVNTKTSGNAFPNTSATITLYKLKNPLSGANNVVVTLASAANMTANAISFTGYENDNGTTTADAGGNQIAGTNLATTISTSIDQCMILGVYCSNQNVGEVIAAGSGTTKRSESSFNNTKLTFFHSTSTVGAGSNSINASPSVTDWLFSIGVALAPPTNGGAFLMTEMTS